MQASRPMPFLLLYPHDYTPLPKPHPAGGHPGGRGRAVYHQRPPGGRHAGVPAGGRRKELPAARRGHGFHGGPRSHGQKHSEREPGSIGGGLRNRVPVGMRMAGRMGSDRITVKNLKVAHIDTEDNVIYVSGAIPGRRGTLVEIVGQ